MGNGIVCTVVSVCLLGLFFVGPAFAANETPGSLLLFPYFDSVDMLTLFSLTNKGPNTVWVRLIWIEGVSCTPFDFWIELTGKDTFTFLNNAIFPGGYTGFLYAYVVDGPFSESEMNYNQIIGQEVVYGYWDNKPVHFSMNALSFQASNAVNGDGKLKLDGVEYSLAPKTLFFPRFMGQGDLFSSRLILINLTGGKYFDAQSEFLFYNDNEVSFSSVEMHDCFEIIPLLTLCGATSNAFLLGSNHDPVEPYGISTVVETGWFEITGDIAINPGTPYVIDKPSIYAVLMEGLFGYSIADLPFQIVSPDYKNGMLWSTSPSGS